MRIKIVLLLLLICRPILAQTPVLYVTPFTQTLLKQTNAAAARSVLGVSTGAVPVNTVTGNTPLTQGNVPQIDASGTNLITSSVTETNGNVGINTAKPLTKLNVVDTVSTSPRGILSTQISDDTNGAMVGFAKARGTPGSETTVFTGDTLGRMMFMSYDGTNYLETGRIEVAASGTVTNTRVPTSIILSTATDDTPSVLTERMRVDSGGNVGIGTTTPGRKLDITGGRMIVRSSREVYSIGVSYVSTEGVFWIGASDAASPDCIFSNSAGIEVVRFKATGNVGIGTTSPNSVLSVNGPISTAVAAGGSATLGSGNSTYLVTSTAQTVTLPTSVGITGRTYVVKLTAAGTGTVATTAGETIDGAATYTLSAQYKYVSVQSDGANWFIIGNN